MVVAVGAAAVVVVVAVVVVLAVPVLEAALVVRAARVLVEVPVLPAIEVVPVVVAQASPRHMVVEDTILAARSPLIPLAGPRLLHGSLHSCSQLQR